MMIHRKLLGIAAAAMLVLGVSGPANAGTIEVQALGGANTITVAVGAVFTVELLVTGNPALGGGASSAYDIGMQWDGGVTPILAAATTATMTPPSGLPAGPNGPSVQSGVSTPGTFTLFGWLGPGYPVLSSHSAGTLVFTAAAIGTTTIREFFNLAGQGILSASFYADCGSSPSTPCTIIPLTVNVIPEPATASLLGLGIAGLVLAGRRRRS